MKRQGNSPKRRIAAVSKLSVVEREDLAKNAQYEGSGHHKRSPADYGLPRTNPRPTKSLCDAEKVVTLEQARLLLREGIVNGLFSDFVYDRFPKFVWCVDTDGEAYEAKTSAVAPGVYHGYPLEKHDQMRNVVLRAWKDRCRVTGQ